MFDEAKKESFKIYTVSQFDQSPCLAKCKIQILNRKAKRQKRKMILKRAFRKFSLMLSMDKQ